MNVKELIEGLKTIKNKELEVYCFNDGELYPIEMIDDSIDDRIDLNMGDVM